MLPSSTLDNPLGCEMMVRRAARQLCQLGEIYSLDYGRRASGKNDRKLTASACVDSTKLPDGFSLVGFSLGNFLCWFPHRPGYEGEVYFPLGRTASLSGF
ncbi:hypothetical protein C8R32_101313 [Nitrosospira sp. Nsp5]|uniref:Uncharacterized protein n=1 Tax=Nitrosospira multiformis TaxID=1231 RepID=A0ABY0TFJ1_9PROT|nr:hypothetical protein C8R32_101313 [Nitrosospira sp. Nsp5]SDQ75124.1 hypothetical protein SAMN05216402_2143 [Nitrosospira multiformis]